MGVKANHDTSNSEDGAIFSLPPPKPPAPPRPPPTFAKIKFPITPYHSITYRRQVTWLLLPLINPPHTGRF